MLKFEDFKKFEVGNLQSLIVRGGELVGYHVDCGDGTGYSQGVYNDDSFDLAYARQFCGNDFTFTAINV